MKIELYNTCPEYVENHWILAFSILPSLTITQQEITFHWLFWGIEFKYK